MIVERIPSLKMFLRSYKFLKRFEKLFIEYSVVTIIRKCAFLNLAMVLLHAAFDLCALRVGSFDIGHWTCYVTYLDFYEMKHYSNNEKKERKKRKQYTDDTLYALSQTSMAQTI
jgi:hypothetical protein